MATVRKAVFINDYYYHVFNRGVDKRITFTDRREFQRAKELLFFYQFSNIPLRFSHFSRLPVDQKSQCLESMVEGGKLVEIISYCLMPNHFHLLLKQKKEGGITTFVSNFANAYTKYFNTKHERSGVLFQSVFKAVFVETDEQLFHLTRYIHLNPVVSSMIEEKNLPKYSWSSYPSYIAEQRDVLVEKDSIKSILGQIPQYKEFVLEQIPYAKKLEKMKHLILD